MLKEKNHVNLVAIGRVDSGKSTVCGHIIYKLGDLDKKIIENVKKESMQLGNDCFKFSFMIDKLKTERERGLTIDITLHKFETQKNNFTLINTPGRRDFLKNMIAGTSQADCALLLVDSGKGVFDYDVATGNQTKEHALLAYTLGVKQMVVGVNKMDSAMWKEETFTEIQKKTSTILNKIGYNLANIIFVPISGLYGDNLFSQSKKMLWYKGPTLIEVFDNITLPKRAIDKPLRIPLLAVYRLKGVGTIPIGIIESGTLKVGQTVTFTPMKDMINTTVNSIEIYHKKITQAFAGDSIAFLIDEMPTEIKRGTICSDSYNNTARSSFSFLAKVIILNHPGEIKKGYCPLVDCHTAHVACKFSEIQNKIDRFTGEKLEKEPKALTNGDCAIIVMTPIKPMCVETFLDYQSLGRFAFRDNKHVVGVGIVIQVEKSYGKEE